jgi:hypothetical protein
VFALPGPVSARDAHFVGGKLVVGDYSKRQITFFELGDGKATAVNEIKEGFRLCCGIFDFCPTHDNDSILVANLGAFKVQKYSKGRKTDEFGARGKDIEEFHGCCNPVNVAALGPDYIVTVEKSPTRVKICDAKGRKARVIDGLGELVDGCSVIPVAVDRKGAIYLASARKRCIAKCVSDDAVMGFSDNKAGASGAATSMSPAAHTELSETREWRHAENGKKIEAKLIAFEGGDASNPIIRDGKIRLLVGSKPYELPLERLSQEDRNFVDTLRNAGGNKTGQ